MKMNRAWKIRLGALCLTGLCLGTGAALAAGDADDPLVTLSYLNETVLPKLLSQTDEKAKVRQTELANQLSQVMAQGGGGASASYTVVTLNPGQRMDLDIGCEVLLRVGSATAGAAVDPALVDVSAGGELYSGGQLMNDVAPKDRDISMVFQNYALYPHMTVRENIAFPLKLRKMDKAEIDQRVEQAAEILDITEYLDRKPKALSGGQRQRVAIVREPKVLLMDEPLSNLDAKLRNQMRAELIKLRQRINTTFIYVTHDQTEAMTLGDRIVIMKDGVIQQIGTPQEVFNHPANLFVAGFIGMPQMNFYDAELVLEDGQYAVVLDGAKVTLPEEKQAKLKANGAAAGPITLGVRPEHLILSGDEGSMIHGTVDVSEMMGSAVHLHVSACGSDTIMIVPTTELESTSAFTIGSPIAFTFNGVMAHLFDRNTQKNLEV